MAQGEFGFVYPRNGIPVHYAPPLRSGLLVHPGQADFSDIVKARLQMGSRVSCWVLPLETVVLRAYA